jgi:hypothetical protein
MLFTTRRRQDSTPTPMPLLQAAARGVETSNWHGKDGEGAATKKKRSHDDKNNGTG